MLLLIRRPSSLDWPDVMIWMIFQAVTMDPSRSIPTETFEQPEESKLGRKMRESPFMVAGKTYCLA